MVGVAVGDTAGDAFGGLDVGSSADTIAIVSIEGLGEML